MKRCRGLSLLEILIGIAIFATVGITFLSFIGQSIGESKFSSDFFTAFILSQKVMEDFAEEIAVNPYGFETLGVDETSTKYSDVVDGSTVYFSSLEDQQKPYGKIDGGTDGTINDKMKPLYDLAKACYQIVVYLEPQFAILETQNSDALKTGGSALNPIMFQEALFNYRIIYEYFSGSIVQTRYYYYTLAEKDLALFKGGKKELQVMQKLMDLYRIVALLPTVPGGMIQYQAFLTRLETFSDGRNPFFQRLVKQELIYLQDQNAWMEKFPNLKRISLVVKDRVPQILAFIKTKTDDAVLNPNKSIPQK